MCIWGGNVIKNVYFIRQYVCGEMCQTFICNKYLNVVKTQITRGGNGFMNAHLEK